VDTCVNLLRSNIMKPTFAIAYRELLDAYPEVEASAEQRLAAEEEYVSDDIEIDDRAAISDPGRGTGYWVSAWVWIHQSENES
jgi:hypothetical protein